MAGRGFMDWGGKIGREGEREINMKLLKSTHRGWTSPIYEKASETGKQEGKKQSSRDGA